MIRYRKSLLSIGIVLASIATLAVTLMPTLAALADDNSFLDRHHVIKTLASTVPANGDVNPYGVAVVPSSNGLLTKGSVLVSNFNASSNLQGTGTTIVQITPDGKTSLFAQLNAATLPGACPGGVGLTTALVVLQKGWVIVGSLPTADGTSATAQAGCLIVLNSSGKAVETFSGNEINGPWDMTVADRGDSAELFVTNVLNGTVKASPNIVNQGTVIRIDLRVPLQGQQKPQRLKTAVIGSGFPERTDPGALVIGPTGVGLGRDGTLYVADSLNSRIASIPNALRRDNSASTGKDVTVKGALNDPLGLTIAPNGNILTVNGNDGSIVETTPRGTQVKTLSLDNTAVPNSANGAGCLFGLAPIPSGPDDYDSGIRFDHDAAGAYFVDDCSNTLNTLT
jgi:sugar lactone lactonase YvrE